MNDMTSVNNAIPGTVAPSARPEREAVQRPPATPEAPAAAQATDRVELSEAAANYDPQAAVDAAMERRVAQIREEIAAGTYLTPEKLDVVVDRLHAELFKQ